MLSEPIMTAFLPTVKPEESRQFYMNTIGLKLVSQDDYASEFEGNGVFLRITTVDRFNPQPFTVLGFKINELVAQVNILQKKGVEFQIFDSLDQDDIGIWTAPSEAKIAWFKDPDGNLISLTEYDNEQK